MLVSLFLEEEATLRARLDWLQDRVTRVELRLDAWPPDLDLAALLREYPRFEWLAACRSEPQGESRRARLQRAAEVGFDWVDFPFEEGPPPDVPRGVRRILSWHQEAPGAEDWSTRLGQMQAMAGADDLCKLVAWADHAEEAWPILDLYAAAPKGQLLAFAQGPGGSPSRALALRHGSPWAYSCWPGHGTAPGQWDLAQWTDLLPSSLGEATPSFGVVGDPVAHSLSPFLWRVASPEVLYLPYRVADLAVFLHGALRRGITAFSVTAPHKQAAYRMAQEQAGLVEGPLGEAASACRAANLLVHGESGWRAGLSDGVGALEALAEQGLQDGQSILVLGGGGAARAVAVEGRRRGHRVVLATRNPFPESGPEAWDPGDWSPLDAAEPADFDAVVQATPVGSVAHPGALKPEQPPRSGALALDMVYHPLQTSWMHRAASAGAVSIPGTRMLLHQMLAQLHTVLPEHALASDAATLGDALETELEARTSVVLIGARASGKSTLGRALAETLGWSFVDADDCLEARSGKRIADWLQEDAAEFRRQEAALLPELIARPYTVVATGGGVVTTEGAMHALRAHPRVVWLDCPQEELLRRQTEDPRPRLLEGSLSEEIAELLKTRGPAYREVARRVISTNESLDSSVMETIRYFRLRRILRGFR